MLRIQLVCMAAIAAMASPARAQEPSDQAAAADALFKEGLRLMKQGEYARACDAFAASHRFEPSVGALLNLGNCREALGQLATAYELFAQAAEDARWHDDGKRVRYARQRMQKLERRLPYMTVEVPDAARAPGLRIRRSGTDVPPSLWNQRIPVDPGSFTLRAEAPGMEPFETVVAVDEAGEISVRVPVLEPAPREPAPRESAPLPEPAVATDLELAAAPVTRAGRADRSPVRGRLAVAGGALGAAGMIAGGVLGWRARDIYADARALCDNDWVDSCTDQARRDSQAGRDRARTLANLATISLSAGAALAVTGVVLWLTGDDPAEEERSIAIVPVMGSSRAGVNLDVRF